ncbi:MAG: hypothetical protein LBG29_03230 [Synergistaceae bacterium]|jgi:hypothetical protein|nr:hypothetical protein [Synergistaceae bacterium]
MKARIRISHARALFWLASAFFYWLLIYIADAAVRFRAFLAVQMLWHVSLREGLSSIMKNLSAIEDEAWLSMARAGPVQGEYAIVTLATAAVLIVVPFVVRFDSKGPVRGFFMLPASIFLSYFFASMLNVILAAGMCWGISLRTGIRIGPDALAYMAHPLSLLAPSAIGSVPATASQLLYLAYAYSVISTPNEAPEEINAASPEELETESVEEWNKTACTMEMDRLTRLIDSKVQNPSLVEKIRRNVSDYINGSPEIHENLKSGAPHYKIVLARVSSALRDEIIENPQNAAASAAILFVADEMEKMEYLTPDERAALGTWLSDTTPAASSDASPQEV